MTQGNRQIDWVRENWLPDAKFLQATLQKKGVSFDEFVETLANTPRKSGIGMQVAGLTIGKMVLARSMQDPSFGAIMFDERLYACVNAASAYGIDVSDAAQLIQESQAMGRFFGGGEKTYEIAPGLTQRLEATRVTGVKSDMLRLPFHSLRIMLPLDTESYTDILVTEAESESLTDARVEELRRMLRATHIAPEFVDRVCREKRVPRRWRILALRGYGETAEGYVSNIFLHDDITLDALLDAQPERKAMQDRAFAFLMNFVLYLSWPDTGEEFIEKVDPRWAEMNAQMQKHPKGSHKRERMKAALKDVHPNRRIYVGAKVPFMEAAETVGSDGKLLVRTLVTGHWKMQAHGPHRSERKLIRIEPYWRGPIDGPVVNPLRKAV